MNLASELISSSYQHLLNQQGGLITLGNGNAVNWNGSNVMTLTGSQTVNGLKIFTDDLQLTRGKFLRWGTPTESTDPAYITTTQDSVDGTNMRFVCGDVVDSNDSFTFQRGGTSLMTIVANGNVGIGDANPQERLDVIGDATIAKFAGNNSVFQGVAIQALGSTSSTARGTFVDYRNENNVCLTSTASYHFTDGSSDFYIHTTPAGSRTADRRVERFRIKGNGNIGIGTDVPSSKVYVVGDGMIIQPDSYTSSYGGGVKFRNEGYAHFTAGVKGAQFVVSNTSSNGANMWASPTDLITINNNGNVGIGLANISTKLHVNGEITSSALGAGGQFRMVYGTYGSILRNDGANFWILSTAANDQYGGWSNQRPFRHIFAENAVEITPATKFFGDAAAQDKVMIYANGSSIAAGYWYYNKQNQAGVISDARIKYDISDIDTSCALDFIKKIKPSKFKVEKNGEYQAGFIAQNLLKSATTEDQKQLINNHEVYDENNPDCPILGVADRPILAYLVAAVKEQQKIIDSLKEEINNIKNTNNQL